MKRVISLLMVFIIMLGLVPLDFAYSAPPTITDADWPGYSSLSPYDKEVLLKAVLQNSPINSLGPGQKANKDTLYIALQPLKGKPNDLSYQRVLVYNYNPEHKDSRGFGKLHEKNQEFKNLGYNIKGEIVTNDLYTNSKATGWRDPMDLPKFTYQKIEDAISTWRNVPLDVTTKMMTSVFKTEDESSNTNPAEYNLKDILSKTVGGNTANDVLKPYLLMQSPSTLTADGSVRTVYKGFNSQTHKPVTAYNTIILPKITNNFNPTVTMEVYEDKACTKVITKKDILPTQDSVTVYVKVKAGVSMESIKLGGQEAKYIESVTNIADGAKESSPITSFSDVNNVSNVYEYQLNRKSFKQTYTDKIFESRSSVKIRYEIMQASSPKAKIILKVRTLEKPTPLNPMDLVPEFKIFYGVEDKTDQAVVHDKDVIDKDFTFDLKDESYVPPDNAIVNWNWFVLDYTKNDFDYFGFTKDTSFTLKVADVAKYVKDDTITFQELVKDKLGKISTITHVVSIIKVPIPIVDKPILPLAYVYPPKMVRAGTECTITGEGMSGNGAITDYAFDFASSFKEIKSVDQQEKEGTFLSFDHSVQNDWSETTGLTVTDALGKTAHAEDKTLVKHPIIPVMKTNGIYKINRTIELDSTESSGTLYYPIDKVTWTIKPMDGQLVDNIKLHDGGTTFSTGKIVVGAKPKVDFKQLGRYEVWMDVHSTCTFAGETYRTAGKQVYGIITIAPDEAPVAKLSVPSKTIRSLENAQQSTYTVWDESYSSDGDNIGKRKFYARFDSNNDKSTSDETWELIYEGPNSQCEYSTRRVGYTEFRVEVEEVNDSVNSPFWNALTDTLRANTDKQPIAEKLSEVINVAPITTILADRKKLDLVLVTDYEGSDFSNLKTELDLLTKDLFEKGVDINIQVCTDKMVKGRVKAPIYTYTRSIRITSTADVVSNNLYTPNQTKTTNTVWETRYQLETDYLPNYGTQYTTFVKGSYDKSHDDIIDRGITLSFSAPTDPYLKNKDTSMYEELIVPSNGIVLYSRNTRDISATVDGNFTKGAIQSYQEMDLYCMNLDAVRTSVTFREGSDRQMVFVMKSGDSLTTLNQTFADFIKQKAITVTALSGFDMTSQYGGLAIQDAEWLRKEPSEMGPGTVQERDNWGYITNVPNYNNMILKGLALQMEGGKTYALSNSHVYWNGQYYPEPDYPVVNAGYVRKRPETLTDMQHIPYTNEYVEYYTPVKPTLGYLKEGNLEVITKDWTLNPESNSQPALTASHRVRNDEGHWEYESTWGERTLGSHMAGVKWGSNGDSNTGTFFFVKNNNLYSMPMSQLANSWTTATLVTANVREASTDGVFTRTSMADTRGLRNQLFIYYPSTNQTRFMFESLYVIEKGKDSYGNMQWDWGYRYNDIWAPGKIIYYDRAMLLMDSGKLYTSKFNEGAQTIDDITLQASDVKSLVTGFEKQAEFSKWKWDGSRSTPEFNQTPYSAGRWYISTVGDLKCYYNGAVYQLTQGMNLKKVMCVNDNKDGSRFGIVFLTNDGKLLAPVNPFTYFESFKGGQAITPATCVNLVKDPRTLSTPVVDALSMRKLLNQNAANKISGTFAEVSNRLKANYEYLKYQTREVKLLDETLTYDTLYFDYEGDALHESAIALSHDQNALESPIGTDSNSGKTVSNWDQKLIRTGLYTIKPKVKDNPSYDDRFSDYRLWNKDDMTLEVLVHRKPIASMKVSVTPTAPFVVTTKDSNSRDLDHISQPTRGIAQVEWGIKKLFDDTWQTYSGVLGATISQTMETGETYIICYRVKDVEGQWSDPVTEQVVAGMNLLMDAKLEPESPTQSLTKFQIGNNVKFTNLWSSYALAHHLEIQMYDGQTPIYSNMVFRKEWGNVRSEAYPERDWNDFVFNVPKGLADKTYTFKVTALDDTNPTIKKYKTFQMTTVSNSAPTITFTKIDPITLYEADRAKVQVKVTDPDGDRLKVQIYISYDGKPEKMLETHENVISGTVLDLAPFEIPNAKSIKLRGVAIDPYLAEGQAEMVKPIQSFGIENVKITGAWQHWRGQQNAFGQLMSNEPNRFLSYEKIYIAVESRGNPDQVKLRLEAPLEAMRYTDPKGNDYDYKDELGYEVSFPINFMPVDVNKFNLEYILPFANSTIDWKDKRKKPPYKLYVTLIKDGRTRMMTIGDDAGEPSIDVTGNIFDLVYNQPAKKKR